MMKHSEVREVLNRKLIFVSGKGGVGKTAISQSIAKSLSSRTKRVLWVAFEDPTRPGGELVQVSSTLSHLNAEASAAFEEYVGMKIGAARLTQIFLQNKVMRYLSKAAPGIHELVLLGKVWHERLNYDHVVCDMPSTGYGLAMFQSAQNFSRLFQGGPIHRDAEAMLATFRDPGQTGFLTVALPEEMPLTESIELGEFLLKLFPENPSAYLVNRRFPEVKGADLRWTSPDDWRTPVPETAFDYARKRAYLEKHNLRLWLERKLNFAEVPYLVPDADRNPQEFIARVAGAMEQKGCIP